MHRLSLITSIALLSLAGCQAMQKNAVTKAGVPHEQTISLLASSDGVIPKRLPSNPMSVMYNREAVIPPQCYTRTEGKHNPCYVCHQDAQANLENAMNDRDLQEAYSFSDVGLTNHWKNLLEDRSERVAAISDSEILDWVNRDNYSDLAPRLQQQTNYQGWIPDLKGLHEGAAAFDNEGFAKDGSQWVAFSYKPFPSTFWPTNGSTDDVMIRLPEIYQRDKNNRYSRDVYKANLAILEANIKELAAITVNAIDERPIGEDLNNDGQLTVINTITQLDSYTGAAQGHYKELSLYPQGTEFLHTVRYLGFNEKGDIVPSRHMKEVRYMKKWQTYPKFVLAQYYLEEAFEKEAGLLPFYANLGDNGLDNGMGWSIQGYIENRHGDLRANNYEENFFCMGCHSSIGSTIDKTFSFGRKVDGANGWGYINLRGMPDAPTKGESIGEIATYLGRAGGGGEFRSNPEMEARWFKEDGTVDLRKVADTDVYGLLMPSRERAMELNKAYRVIVADQDFIYGRDATVTPPKNVYKKIDVDTAPTLPTNAQYDWDIRLDWHQSLQQASN